MDLIATERGEELKFGFAEKVIAAVISALFVAGLGWLGTSYMGMGKSLNDLKDSQTHNATQLAVINAQLSSIRAQLADIPGMREKISEMQVQVRRNASDIRDLQSRRTSQ